jgi:hypothetical protein
MVTRREKAERFKALHEREGARRGAVNQFSQYSRPAARLEGR